MTDLPGCAPASTAPSGAVFFCARCRTQPPGESRQASRSTTIHTPGEARGNRQSHPVSQQQTGPSRRKR
ncbi:hypothetical protein LHGZ1_2753 [Laribacter hongkongensis]|uniref:Uncharacterized protein n=1 Tax=Laribacter hongkongensis TaxID=168471 RepID=A0A248LMA3_9NEIS|nr:hypothetical protein LHGZ1_2753 [Laribacter hongkongensis]